MVPKARLHYSGVDPQLRRRGSTTREDLPKFINRRMTSYPHGNPQRLSTARERGLWTFLPPIHRASRASQVARRSSLLVHSNDRRYVVDPLHAAIAFAVDLTFDFPLETWTCLFGREKSCLSLLIAVPSWRQSQRSDTRTGRSRSRRKPSSLWTTSG